MVLSLDYGNELRKSHTRTFRSRSKKYATGIGLVSNFVRSLREENLLPEEFSKPEDPFVATPVEKPAVKVPESTKIFPEIPLEEEWQRQSRRFVELGFHEELGLTGEEYIATLPKFEPQPEEWKGRMDTPVIVEIRISPKRQSELAGLKYFLEGVDKADWNKTLKGYIAPEGPYAVWLDDGRNHMKKSVKDVRKNLKADELAGAELDGIALYVSNPKILEHHFLDLPGTSVESDGAAGLRLWDGGPEVFCSFVGGAHPRFGSVVRGRQK